MKLVAASNVAVLCFLTMPLTASSQGSAAWQPRFDRDAGKWIGLSAGVQANGAPFNEAITGMISYEYRFKDPVGLIFSFQSWQTKFTHQDNGTSRDVFTSSGSLMAGMKLRLPFQTVTPFVTGGIGTAWALIPVLFYYSVGLEFPFLRRIHLGIEARRTTIYDDSFFFMGGVVATF